MGGARDAGAAEIYKWPARLCGQSGRLSFPPLLSGWSFLPLHFTSLHKSQSLFFFLLIFSLFPNNQHPL